MENLSSMQFDKYTIVLIGILIAVCLPLIKKIARCLSRFVMFINALVISILAAFLSWSFCNKIGIVSEAQKGLPILSIIIVAVSGWLTLAILVFLCDSKECPKIAPFMRWIYAIIDTIIIGKRACNDVMVYKKIEELTKIQTVTVYVVVAFLLIFFFNASRDRNDKWLERDAILASKEKMQEDLLETLRTGYTTSSSIVPCKKKKFHFEKPEFRNPFKKREVKYLSREEAIELYGEKIYGNRAK